MNHKYDLSEVTIIIPFQYDSPERQDNLSQVLKYLEHYFHNLDCIIMDASKISIGDSVSSYAWVKHQYLENEASFHKTKYFNIGARLSVRPSILCYDTDVLFHPQSIIEAQLFLKSSPSSIFCFPFNGQFWNVAGENKQKFLKTRASHQFPIKKTCKVGDSVNNLKLIHPNSPGGATFFRRAEFLALGGYNERFISWGWEDNEIVTRFSKLGYPPVHVSSYGCVHLDHPRGQNSSSAHAYFKKNFQEYKKIFRLTPLELCGYIQSKLGVALGSEILRNAKLLEPQGLLKWAKKIGWWLKI